MSYDHQNIKSNIMGKVGGIYIARKIVEPGLMFPIVGVIAGVLYLLSAVSIRNVFNNMPSITDVDAFLAFYQSAIINTEIAVQLSIAVFAIGGAILIARALRAPQFRLA